MSRHVKLMFVLAAVVMLSALLTVSLRPASPRELFFDMRPDLSLARQAADSCTSELAVEQAGFDAFVDRVDGLRSRIERLEALDDRGVPADSYAEYIEAVDSFNVVTPGWESAADSLRLHRQSCKDLVRTHNLLADSARALAERAELLDGRGRGEMH